jgi:hypothetical protein
MIKQLFMMSVVLFAMTGCGSSNQSVGNGNPSGNGGDANCPSYSYQGASQLQNSAPTVTGGYTMYELTKNTSGTVTSVKIWFNLDTTIVPILPTTVSDFEQDFMVNGETYNNDLTVLDSNTCIYGSKTESDSSVIEYLIVQNNTGKPNYL